MSARRLHIAIIAMFAVLFLSLQSFALGHNAAYGDGPHEHDGVACDVSVLTSEDIAVVPVTPSFNAPAAETTAETFTAYRSARYLRPIVRGPPPRSPPTA